MMAVAAMAGITALAAADGETVVVQGSEVRYLLKTQVTVGYQPVRLVLTGTAMRKGHGLNIYAIASYIQDGVAAKTAEQIVAADAVKMMHLTLERNLDGQMMFDGIRSGIRLNHSLDAFTGEMGQLERTLRANDWPRGQALMLTSLPKVGLRCQAPGKADVMIANPAFAKAVWEIFLGRNSLGDAVKSGLTSRR
jgi:hypothetical protein